MANRAVPPPPIPQTDTRPRKSGVRGFFHGFWTFVDVVAILGSVGGALAALTGVVSAAYVLPLPVVLPIVSLIAAMQREGLSSQVGTGNCPAERGQLGRPEPARHRQRRTHNLLR